MHTYFRKTRYEFFHNKLWMNYIELRDDKICSQKYLILESLQLKASVPTIMLWRQVW